MTVMDGDEMHRLWALVADLTSQLTLNRQHLADVQAQVEILKGRAFHNQTGFALRRFNVDVAKEKFESELERLNVHLVQENNELKWENRMNDRLIKEYEQCLEIVMKKFRTFSHATQSYSLKLTQHYEDLLASNTHNASSASLHASTTISSTLSYLGMLVRSALREVEGEGQGAYLDDEEPPSSFDASSFPEPSRQPLAYGSASDPRWYGSGGYTGKLGDPDARRSDAALERATELQRLRMENEELRRVLDLAEGKGLDVGFGKEKLSLGLPRRPRKASVSQANDTAQQQQQHQQPQQTAQAPQPLLPAPRASSSRLPIIPAAPLPTASIDTTSAAAREVAAPPLPIPKPYRTPLKEKLQQAAEAIPRTSPPSVKNDSINNGNSSFNSSMGLPSIPDILLDTGGATVATGSSSSKGNSTTLIPTPAESAPAQSDIRSAPVLPLSSPNGDGSTSDVSMAATTTSDGDVSSPLPTAIDVAVAAAATSGVEGDDDGAIDASEETGLPKALNGEAVQSVDVPRDDLDLLLGDKQLAQDRVSSQESGDGIEEESEPEAPATEEIDLSDGEPLESISQGMTFGVGEIGDETAGDALSSSMSALEALEEKDIEPEMEHQGQIKLDSTPEIEAIQQEEESDGGDSAVKPSAVRSVEQLGEVPKEGEFS